MLVDVCASVCCNCCRDVSPLCLFCYSLNCRKGRPHLSSDENDQSDNDGRSQTHAQKHGEKFRLKTQAATKAPVAGMPGHRFLGRSSLCPEFRSQVTFWPISLWNSGDRTCRRKRGLAATRFARSLSRRVLHWRVALGGNHTCAAPLHIDRA